jgi:TRAP-type C4-dicarboxylate transport system permease large subunit
LQTWTYKPQKRQVVSAFALTYIPSQVLQIVGRLALAAKDAALPLMIPVILLGGILTGWFTPTEAGVVAVV